MSANEDYQFVDSIVLVYAHDISAGEKRERALELVQALWESRRGCISIQVLQEFYVAITQKVPEPVSRATAERIIQDLSLWRVHSPNARDVLGAIDLQHRYQISFWDAMIVQSAVQAGCEVLWTEDLSVGQLYGGVIVENPF